MTIQQKRLLSGLRSLQRQESPMDHGQRSMVADTFPWVFSEALLNACGKDAQCCRRERLITPCRLGVALTATWASQRVETLAALHRGFQALSGTAIPYTAFDNQVAKPHCADGARTMTARLLGDMPLQVLGFHKGQACAAFPPSVMQDGSSLAMPDRVRAVFPGRCTAVKPAAGALHATRDWRCDAPTTVVLPPETTQAQAFVPEPATRTRSVLVAARGSSA